MFNLYNCELTLKLKLDLFRDVDLNNKFKTIQLMFADVSGALHQVNHEPDGVGNRCIEDIAAWIAQHI